MKRALVAGAAAVLMGLGSTAAFAMPQWHNQGQQATHALNLLESRGYGGFSNFHAVGQNFAATVMQNGKTMHLMIYPNTNQIQVAT